MAVCTAHSLFIMNLPRTRDTHTHKKRVKRKKTLYSFFHLHNEYFPYNLGKFLAQPQAILIPNHLWRFSLDSATWLAAAASLSI